MDKIIVYPKDESGICIVYPTQDCGLPVEEIAKKDVPSGKPYLILPANEEPKDHVFFDAFEADFSQPHGYGIGAQSWFIKKYQSEISQLDAEKDAQEIQRLQKQIAIQQLEMST